MLDWLIGQLFKASHDVPEGEIMVAWDEAIEENDAWDLLYKS